MSENEFMNIACFFTKPNTIISFLKNLKKIDISHFSGILHFLLIGTKNRWYLESGNCEISESSPSGTNM